MDLSPIVKLLSRRRLARLARQDYAGTQEHTLRGLVHRARETRFGRDHDFARIRTVADFQERVPIRAFEDLWADYWRGAFPLLDNVTWPGRIPYFARTSGTTTGTTKHIPVTRAVLRGNEKAGFDLMSYHLDRHPESRPLSGKSFIIAGSTALEELATGVFAGDVSGINTKTTPFWVRDRIFPTPDLALISKWDEKLEVLSRAVMDQRVTMISGVCTWVLAMLDRVRERKEQAGTLTGPTFPDLQLLIHSGVPMDLYRGRLARHLDGAPVDPREVYAASEGFIAVADRGAGEGMRLMLDNGLFLEFVPLAELGSARPTRHWVKTIEPGIDYAIILSTCAGLWSYLLGDVVRFVDTDPPRLLIQGRVSQMLSPFGEHLIGAEIDQAVRAAAAVTGVTIAEYTVGAVLPEAPGEAGYHVYIVEPEAPIPGDGQALADRFARLADAKLIDLNADYASPRRGSSGIAAPVVLWVAPGTFAGWMRGKGKLGSQHKVPRVMADATRFAVMAGELGIEPNDLPRRQPA